MMTSETFMQSFQLQFPLSFIKDALKLVERDETCVLKRKGILPKFQQEINITFTRVRAHLNVTFENFPLSISDGTYECIINSTDDEAVAVDDELEKRMEPNEPVSSHQNSDSEISDQQVLTAAKESIKQPQPNNISGNISTTDMLQPETSITPVKMKRKRGRPKKVKCLIETGEAGTNYLNSENSIELENSCSTNTGEKIDESVKMTDTGENALSPNSSNIDGNLPEKRYGLRGKKLNSKLMALVKSSGIDGNDSDDESVTLSDSGSDYETSRFKNKDMMKNNDTGSCKENKTFSKKIKEQVKDILSKGSVFEIIKQTRGRIVECKMCGKKIYGYTAAYKHVLKMHKKSAVQEEYLNEICKLKERSCSFCGEIFIDSSSLNNHKETAHKNVDFPCPLCDYRSNNVSNLKMHVRNMHVDVGKKAFCHLCPASFRAQGSLRQHIDLNHYGNKYVKCDICSKQFYNNSQLRRHMKVHGSNLSKRFSCKICGKSFNFEYNLKRHISAIHQPQSESYHCSYCGKGFSQKVPMITHVQHVHFNIFPYSCKECKASFLKAPLLKEHMMSVHHITDFQVPVVPKNSIYDKGDDDRFYCSYCSESFAHKIRLIEHVHGDHADAFPYKCDTCVQGFLEQSFLKLHKLKAHGEMLQTEEILAHTNSAGEILQIITTKNGYPNKVMSTLSGTDVLDESDETFQEGQAVVITDDTNSHDNFSTNLVETVPPQPSSSLLVEVAQGSNTYQYVIETPESIGHSDLAMQDIANLLIAAGKTTEEDQVKVLGTAQSSVQEISLVIDENGQSHISTVENQTQPVDSLIGQNEQNISLVAEDNQNQPMEVVIDENEQNSEVFTIENQAQTLQIEHGDIIEMNDSHSADGKNYYRIINVLDNQS